MPICSQFGEELIRTFHFRPVVAVGVYGGVGKLVAQLPLASVCRIVDDREFLELKKGDMLVNEESVDSD